MLTKKTLLKKIGQATMVATGLGTLALMAFAQDFPMHSGNPNRSGLPVDINGGAFTPNIYNDIGRAFLRWWDPVRAISTVLDNDEAAGATFSTGVPLASWIDATGLQTVAFGYEQKTLGNPIYRYAALRKGTNADDPTAGSNATYVWTFGNLNPNSNYELHLNLPIGPTDTGGFNYVFPEKYWVVRVTGDDRGNHTDVIDYDLHAGGYVRLGNNGNDTNFLFSPTGTTLTVVLYNTAPVGENGRFLDPNLDNDPTLLARQVVYADACQLVNTSTSAKASYTASPIVSRLNAPPPQGGVEAHPIRTVASRNEVAVVGDNNTFYNLGITTSYDFNGAGFLSPFSQRYNKAFSWPVKRPFDNSDAEQTQFGIDKRNWILEAGKNRDAQKIQVDNLNGGASATAGFIVQPSGANNLGPNFLEAPAVPNAATEQATFGAQMPEGSYYVDVWLPGAGGNARDVQINIIEGGVTVDTLSLDMNGAQGWTRIPFQSATGYSNSQAVPLTVGITNLTGTLAEAGKPVQADAVRFVRQSDLSVDSTPVQVTTNVTVAGNPVQRDVLIVPMENGRLYCIDAHGDTLTGAAPPVYWTFPTEGTPDPNNSPAEDGKDRIAEMPTGFDMSSAFVQNVNGNDYLYIASQNGKVYCIDMAGRGDGTTRRVWTYPDDYDPSLGNQDLPMQPGLLPIKGSVAFGTAAGNVPIVIVPTQEGRIIALDAAGNPATKKTTVVWEYPTAVNPTLGPVESTPVVQFGKVFFNASPTQGSVTGTVYAVNEADGTLSWTQDAAAFGNFALFGPSSPVAVPGTMLQDPGGNWGGILDVNNDRVFVADSFGRFASLDPANGNIVWTTNEVTSGSVGPLRFSYSTQFDNLNLGVHNLVQNVPTVFMASYDGQLTGFNALGSTTPAGNSKIWGYRTEGSAQMATFANGGFNLANNPHSWMYVGDSQGFFYAFNSIDDNNILPVMPGVPPGQQNPGENEPGLDELNSAIDPNNFVLLSPTAFDQIREMADAAGGISKAQLDAIVTADKVQRRHFEFGETLRILVYDLPTGANMSGQNQNYYIEVEVSSAGRPSQRRQIPVRTYSSDPDHGFMLTGIPMATTGIAGVGPGANYLTVKAVAPANRGISGQLVHLPKPATFVPPIDCDFMLANPLGIAMLDSNGNVSQSVCLNALANTDPHIDVNTGSPYWPLYNSNGNNSTDQAPGALPVEPIGYVGPDLKSKGEPVSHGSTGVQQLYVADRSLMNLLLGRGLSGIRVGPQDIAWVKDPAQPLTGGVYHPLLDNGVRYPGFEDLPLNVPNTSLDYPDVGREALSMTANIFGQAQNPLYVSGIEANAPVYSQTDLQNYLTLAGFEAQLNRRLSMTIFEINMSVPKFQPPSSKGYYGSQRVFVDSQAGGVNPNVAPDPFRTFGLGLNVGIDERIAFKTPTVDLSSMPSGGGYNGGPSFGPLNPWDPTTAFSPWNPNFNNLFQTFEVDNDGNVNMLNLRTAKYFYDANGNRPVELYMPGQHELAWLDASLHLHTSLDPRFSSSALVGAGSVGYDVLGRNILQKPRPRDIIGTRLNVNPKYRPNANLHTAGGFLYDTSVIVPGDPKMGITAPIGAPAGEYIRKIYVFENSDTANDVNANNPSLGNDEPFTDPATNLKFTVRESRLTNSMTIKSAPMVDNLLNGTENFAWSNTQPTAMRDGVGNLFLAWASNRVDNGNLPSWNAKGRVDTDLLGQDKWRIYVGSLHSVLGNVLGQSPVADLNAWNSDTANRWFKQTLIIDPPTTLFDVNTAAGESLDLASVRFGSPVFPSSGFFNQLDLPGAQGRPWFTGRYLAFLGEATKYDAAGTATQLSQIFLVPMTMNADGTIAYNPNQITVSPFDTSSKKSRLGLIHQRNGSTDYASVYASSFSGGNGQIVWNTYDSQSWRQGSLRLGSAFENMGAPNAVLRRYQNSRTARVDLTFTAKVKGRRYSEAYMARLNAVPITGFPQGRNPLVPFGSQTDPYVDEITVDTSTGIYWTPGLQWLTDQASMNQVDITTDPSGLPAYSIWDGNANNRYYDVTSGVLKFGSKLGGEVVIDTNNGSIRLNGAVIKRNTRLYIKYRPTIMRISQGDGANYRSIASVYDDRFIGIRTDPTNPQRNLIGDLTNWMGEVNPAVDTDPVRWDRTVVAYTRTSGDGTAATRPFLQTLRPGVRLQYAIETNAAGGATLFRVDNWGGGVASEHFCQYDPATGRVFFMAGNEDHFVQITYNAVDEAGRPLGQKSEQWQVRLIPELNEQAVPIEQVGNESALSICLDPLNGTFNSIDPQTGRRPGLLWLFWSSARTGQPDIYFETIAPRFVPKKGTQ